MVIAGGTERKTKQKNVIHELFLSCNILHMCDANRWSVFSSYADERTINISQFMRICDQLAVKLNERWQT